MFNRNNKREYIVRMTYTVTSIKSITVPEHVDKRFVLEEAMNFFNNYNIESDEKTIPSIIIIGSDKNIMGNYPELPDDYKIEEIIIPYSSVKFTQTFFDKLHEAIIKFLKLKK